MLLDGRADLEVTEELVVVVVAENFERGSQLQLSINPHKRGHLPIDSTFLRHVYFDFSSPEIPHVPGKPIKTSFPISFVQALARFSLRLLPTCHS